MQFKFTYKDSAIIGKPGFRVYIYEIKINDFVTVLHTQILYKNLKFIEIFSNLFNVYLDGFRLPGIFNKYDKKRIKKEMDEFLNEVYN